MPLNSTVIQSPLRKLIEDNHFWSLPDFKLLEVIKTEYPQELARLQKATFVRDESVSRPSTRSISEELYGQDFPEVNRTLVGVLALRWIYNNEYDVFIGSQSPQHVILSRQSFDWLRKIFKTGLRTHEDIYTLITSMIINDLGKDPSLATDYSSRKGADISKVNHDMILYHAVEAGLVPSLDRLTEENKNDLLMGIKLGSDFNFGQLAQAENAPASLSGLLEMGERERAFELRFMEQILDLSGAAGHEDCTCAKKMTEPIFQSYKNVYDVAHEIITRTLTLRQGYDLILSRKLELLRKAGYSHDLDINLPTDRALMRLFCLGNTTDVETADIFFQAFTQRISQDCRTSLIRSLNLDGTRKDPAVQPTYIPAMFTKAINNTAHGSKNEKINAVAALLRYLARCMIVDPSSLQRLPKGVTVIERDVKKLIPVLEGSAFKQDPDILDQESLPDDQVANLDSLTPAM